MLFSSVQNVYFVFFHFSIVILLLTWKQPVICIQYKNKLDIKIQCSCKTKAAKFVEEITAFIELLEKELMALLRN